MSTYPKLSTLLERADRQALLDLIERLLAVEPSLVALALASLKQPGDEPFDPSQMRQRADAIFARYEPGWHSRLVIPAALDRLEEIARAHTDSGNPRAAASGYAGLLLSIATHMEWQDECEYDWLLERCVEQLTNYHNKEKDKATREAVVAIFGEVLAYEITTGYGLDRFVQPLFLAHASTLQRRALLETICTDLQRRQIEDRRDQGYQRLAVARWVERLLPGEEVKNWLPPLSAALPHLQERVEALIAKGKSHSYSEACTWIKRIEGCYRASGDVEGFERYLAELRSRYASRKSLMRALVRAGF
jgi:hypothetical protein